MRSYQTFGQRKPIVALKDGTVIAGNHQLEAAKRLGWTEMAVVTVDDDDTTAKAYALADNKTADLGTYDDELLANLLADVAVDPELLNATGYDDKDIEDLLYSIDTEKESATEDATASLLNIIDVTLGDPETQTSSGDIWLIDNRHILLIEDVFRGHQKWVNYLDAGATFLPYPEPMVTLAVNDESIRLVMVQPNTYLAGHLLDNHKKVYGDDSCQKR
jgi:hypothetical protein